MHIQDNTKFGIKPLNNVSKLRIVIYVNDVTVLFAKIQRDFKSIDDEPDIHREEVAFEAQRMINTLKVLIKQTIIQQR